MTASCSQTSLPERGICAHRGDVEHAPENTVPAFVMAADKGCQMVEFDVWMTSDGELVIMHDETVDRTTDGSGRIVDLTLKQIRQLDAGGWFSQQFSGTKVPTLEEALQALDSYELWLNVHTRNHGQRDEEYVERVVDVIRAAGAQEKVVLACFAEQAEIARRRLPGVKICNMTGQSHAGSDYPETTIRLGADFLQFFGWHERTAEAVRLLHENGVRVNYFKADEAAEIRRLLEIGVDFVLTDRLDTGLEVWAQMQGGA